LERVKENNDEKMKQGGKEGRKEVLSNNRKK
jgi:hypothetical protein